MGIDVACRPEAGGWVCEVTVDDGRGQTHHTVTVSHADLERLDPGAPGPRRLVRVSFDFLLEREAKEAILREFALPVIGRYFPEYERVIAPRSAEPIGGGE